MDLAVTSAIPKAILVAAPGVTEIEKHVNDPRVRALLLKTRFSLADLRTEIRRALPLAG